MPCCFWQWFYLGKRFVEMVRCEWAMMNGEHNITITDEMGNTANITTYDVYQSNGVIHVIDKVVMPKM